MSLMQLPPSWGDLIDATFRCSDREVAALVRDELDRWSSALADRGMVVAVQVEGEAGE